MVPNPRAGGFLLRIHHRELCAQEGPWMPPPQFKLSHRRTWRGVRAQVYFCAGTNIASMPNAHGPRNTTTKDSSGNIWAPPAQAAQESSQNLAIARRQYSALASLMTITSQLVALLSPQEPEIRAKVEPKNSGTATCRKRKH